MRLQTNKPAESEGGNRLAGKAGRLPEPQDFTADAREGGQTPPQDPELPSAIRIAKVVGDLPAMPHIAAQVLDKLSDEDTNPKEIHQLITQDQALAARVLKVANSPFYGASRSISTLKDAVMFMGFDSIRSLIMTAVLKSMYSKVGLAEQLLWEHSTGCGLAARKIADELRFPRKEEAYMAGLMHDVGKTALFLHAPGTMRDIMEEVYNEGLDFAEAEQRRFGFTHALVGGAIANKWRFASTIEDAIADHHEPEPGPTPSQLTQIVNGANVICHKLEVGPTRRPDMDLTQVKSLKFLGLGPERIENLVAAIGEALRANAMPL
ncbi:MAG: HDOD domain-containing protein [Syntrophobacteraceae bacterium]